MEVNKFSTLSQYLLNRHFTTNKSQYNVNIKLINHFFFSIYFLNNDSLSPAWYKGSKSCLHTSHTFSLYHLISIHNFTRSNTERRVSKPVYFISLNRHYLVILHLVLFLYLHHMYLTLFLASRREHT